MSITKIYFSVNILFIVLYACRRTVFFAYTKAAVVTNAVRAILFAYLRSYVIFYFWMTQKYWIINIYRGIIFKLHKVIWEKQVTKLNNIIK